MSDPGAETGRFLVDLVGQPSRVETPSVACSGMSRGTSRTLMIIPTSCMWLSEPVSERLANDRYRTPHATKP